MSIARAFTTRRVKQSLMGTDGSDSFPHRSNSTKPQFGSIRNKISAPVELIHTTNMLSYNAPDIHPKLTSPTSTSSSSHKSDDDLSDSAQTNASSPPTSPDIESPPKRCLSPEPNHLSCYFTVPGMKETPTVTRQQQQSRPQQQQQQQSEAPVIPQRAPSHTKKPYEGLVTRQRSTSRLSEQSQRTVSSKASFSFSRSSSSSTSTTATSQSSAPQQHQSKVSSAGSFVSARTTQSAAVSQASSTTSTPPVSQSHRKDFSQSQHPFGQELAQVSEIAEEYGVKERLLHGSDDAEEKEMTAMGLCKFSADDYLGEIQGLITSLFGDVKKPLAAGSAMWI